MYSIWFQLSIRVSIDTADRKDRIALQDLKLHNSKYCKWPPLMNT